MRLEKLLKRTLGPGALCALVLTACGSQQKPAASATGTSTTAARSSHTVWIYSSLPQRGPDSTQASQIRDGIQLALKPVLAEKSFHGLQVRYKALNDSFTRVVTHRHGAASPSTGNKSDSGTTVTRNGNTNGANQISAAANAHLAARNPETVAYIGDLNSEATEVSLPILNQAGILQVTPGSGYPGLTDSFKAPITALGEPGRYYPQNQQRTLLRLIPSDVVQAAAAVDFLHEGGCQRIAAWESDSTPEAKSLSAAVQQTALKYKMTVIATTAPPSTVGKLYSYVLTLRPKQIGCVVLVGRVTHTAAMLTTELREQLHPSPPIVGTSGFCNSQWTHWIPKADAATVVPGMYCTTPTRPLRTYPSGRRFAALLHAAHPHEPATAYGYYGYEAAQVVLRALRQLDEGVDTRAQVLDSVSEDILLSASAGAYMYGDNGISEYSSAYSIANFPHGIPSHYKTLTPAPLLSSGG